MSLTQRGRASALATALLTILDPPAATADSSHQGWNRQDPYAAPYKSGLNFERDRRPLDGTYRDRPVRLAADWSGPYAGASVGAGIGSTDTSGTVSKDAGTSGFLGGVYTGYNFQLGSVVTGVEADAALANIDGSNGGGLAISSSHDWLTSLRVRLGYTTGSWLFYGTAGFALSDFELDLRSAGLNASLSDTSFGYAIGGGLEYEFTTSISARVEALHYDFDQETFPLSGGSVTANPDVTTIRAGLTLKFN
jgi:outer membrane immunogenic protein